MTGIDECSKGHVSIFYSSKGNYSLCPACALIIERDAAFAKVAELEEEINNYV